MFVFVWFCTRSGISSDLLCLWSKLNVTIWNMRLGRNRTCVVFIERLHSHPTDLIDHRGVKFPYDLSVDNASKRSIIQPFLILFTLRLLPMIISNVSRPWAVFWPDDNTESRETKVTILDVVHACSLQVFRFTMKTSQLFISNKLRCGKLFRGEPKNSQNGKCPWVVMIWLCEAPRILPLCLYQQIVLYDVPILLRE